VEEQGAASRLCLSWECALVPKLRLGHVSAGGSFGMAIDLWANHTQKMNSMVLFVWLHREGYNRQGLHKDGYDRAGLDRYGFDKTGHNKDGYDRWVELSVTLLQALGLVTHDMHDMTRQLVSLTDCGSNCSVG
jgi:hypothetical protein